LELPRYTFIATIVRFQQELSEAALAATKFYTKTCHYGNSFSTFAVLLMIMLQRFFAYYLATLVLLTNVGIPVFTHVCNGEGKIWSSILVPKETCCSTKKQANPQSDCHTEVAPQYVQQVHPKSCCQSYTDLLQIQSDFLAAGESSHSKNMDQALLPLPVFAAFFSAPALHSAPLSFHPHSPPVPLHGRSMLVFKQVFRC